MTGLFPERPGSQQVPTQVPVPQLQLTTQQAPMAGPRVSRANSAPLLGQGGTVTTYTVDELRAQSTGQQLSSLYPSLATATLGQVGQDAVVQSITLATDSANDLYDVSLMDIGGPQAPATTQYTSP